MPLPIVVDKLEDIEEAKRSVYVEREGKFYLDAEIEDVSGLKTALQKEREARQKAAQKNAEYEARIEADRKAMEEAELAKKGLTDVKKDWDEKILSPVLSERDQLKAEIRSMKLDSQVKAAAVKAGVIDEADFWKICGDDFDLSEDGKPFWKSDPTLDISKAILSYKKDKGHLFKGTQATGGGAGGSSGGGKGGSGSDPRNWTAEQRAQYAQENGIPALRKAISDSINKKAAA